MLSSIDVRRGLLACLGAWLLVACSSAPPSAPPSGSAPAPATSTPLAAQKDASPPAASPEAQALLKCDPQQLPFPLPVDTRNCQHLGAVTNFQTGQPPEQVMQFYREYLEKNGWARDDDGALPLLSIWVKESTRMSVATTAQNSITSVQIGVATVTK